MSALRPAAAPGEPVECNGDCGRTWLQDPPYEVRCPTCGANPGARCKRPGGYSGPFVDFHAERDLAAYAAGFYGGPCCHTNDTAASEPAPVQADLFAS